jgi:uncharacterized protein (TIGR03067 family)
MRCCLSVVLGLLAIVPAPVQAQEVPAPAPGSREEASRRELAKLQGSWRFQSWQDGSKKALPGMDKRSFFVGGDVFLVRQGPRVLQLGTLRLSPSKKPMTIDAIVRKGQHEGNTMLGIYELTGDTLKVCFDPEGDARPKKFAPAEGSARYVAVFKRVRPAGEAIDIVGRYRSVSYDPDGKKQVIKVEIQRLGDAYRVRWLQGKATNFVGTGIRKGDTLSVAWLNRGAVGISVFTIEKGPRLTGTFTEVGGVGNLSVEELVPDEAPKTEARREPRPRVGG